MPDLIAYVCPACRKIPGSYYGHLHRPGTRGELCPNHISRDKAGQVVEERVELVPAK